MSEGVGGLLRDARLNAVLAWALGAFVTAVAVANLAAGSVLWAGFAAAIAVLALIPAAKFRSARAMLPWEVLALAALPLFARTIAPLAAFRSDVASYLSVAALALLVAVELQLLTPVEMNHRFAVAFVVIATMGTAGAWAVIRYASDLALGTALVLPPDGLAASEAAIEAAERALMLEFVASFLAGIAAGVLFEFYFRRRERARIDALLAELDLDVDDVVPGEGGES